MQRINCRKPLVVTTFFFVFVMVFVLKTFADVKGAKDGEAEGGGGLEHLHFPTPWPYVGKTPPDEIWTDSTVLARGKQIYMGVCFVCHGERGDGHGPASAGLFPPAPDFTEAEELAEMGPDFWLWRVSEGGAVQPYKSLKSAMPPFKHLSEDDRWAVIAYQHTFSGHEGPHTEKQHPDVDAAFEHAKMVYEMACAWCHGIKGKGDGSVAYSMSPTRAPRPRDFTQGQFKFRSTPTGQLPTDEDLFRTITRGIPGYMPSFRGIQWIERWMVTYYLKQFIPPEMQAQAPQPITIVGELPPASPESLTRGGLLYRQAECWTCHGREGRGDGPTANTLENAQHLPITAADLARPSTFKNGSAAEDIYRTIMTGLTGTPMPSYGDAFEGQEEDVWHLVNFIRSLSRE
ncbi:MAG: c-type cytochrome [Candidatus Tectomicrobia bacterium]